MKLGERLENGDDHRQDVLMQSATLFFMDNKGDCAKVDAVPLLYLLVSYNCPPERTFYGLIITVVPIGAQL